MAGNHSSVCRPKVVFGLGPRESPQLHGAHEKALRAPHRVIAFWARLQTQAPNLAGSLENEPLLSPGSTLEEL